MWHWTELIPDECMKKNPFPPKQNHSLVTMVVLSACGMLSSGAAIAVAVLAMGDLCDYKIAVQSCQDQLRRRKRQKWSFFQFHFFPSRSVTRP